MKLLVSDKITLNTQLIFIPHKIIKIRYNIKKSNYQTKIIENTYSSQHILISIIPNKIKNERN